MTPSELDRQRKIYKAGLILFAVIFVIVLLSFILPPTDSDAVQSLYLILYVLVIIGVIIGGSRLLKSVPARVLQRTLALVMSILFTVLTCFLSHNLGYLRPITK